MSSSTSLPIRSDHVAYKARCYAESDNLRYPKHSLGSAENIDGHPSASLSVGSILMEDWVLYLEQGSQESGGSSGWGAIRNPHLVFA